MSSARDVIRTTEQIISMDSQFSQYRKANEMNNKKQMEKLK